MTANKQVFSKFDRENIETELSDGERRKRKDLKIGTFCYTNHQELEVANLLEPGDALVKWFYLILKSNRKSGLCSAYCEIVGIYFIWTKERSGNLILEIQFKKKSQLPVKGKHVLHVLRPPIHIYDTAGTYNQNKSYYQSCCAPSKKT